MEQLNEKKVNYMNLKEYEYKSDFSLKFKVSQYFEENSKLTLSAIKNLLLQENIEYTDKELLAVITDMLVRRGNITKNDFWTKETEYMKLNQHYTLSSYSKHYYSFEIDDFKTKKILLIADTHIGNNKFEDFKLLDNLYSFAIHKGATKCFHLGDVFSGNPSQEQFDLNIRDYQLQNFIHHYPNPLPNEMMTYAISGNHDQQIDPSLWHTGFSSYYYDLRALNYFNPSFYMLPLEKINIDFLDKPFILSHRFHHSALIPNLVMHSVNDLTQNERWLCEDYAVHISGHLHKGIIYGAGPAKYSSNDQLFLGVPSTSKININNAVAYLITINYQNNTEITNMDIDILNCDNNYKITIQESLNWNFSNNNTYKKIKILEKDSNESQYL